MKWTVLGKSGAFPAPGGATSGYLLQINDKNILVDCGSGVLSNLFRHISVSSLDAVIITHLHYDHVGDLPVLRYAVNLSRLNGVPVKTIPVFAPSSPEPVASTLQSDDSLVIGQLKDGMELDLFGIAVRFSAMEHPVETYGVRFGHEGRAIVYSGDSIPCENLRHLLREADLAILDAGALERMRRPTMAHMTAAECGALAREAGVRRLVLSHIMPFYDEAEILAEARTAFPEAVVAQIGDAYAL